MTSEREDGRGCDPSTVTNTERDDDSTADPTRGGLCRHDGQPIFNVRSGFVGRPERWAAYYLRRAA